MTTYASLTGSTRSLTAFARGSALALALLAASTAAAQTVVKEDVVMYGIDADTRELLRYSFETDTYTVIGVATNDKGQMLTDCEGMAFVPYGPAKGMYVIPRKGASAGDLVRISPLDASGITIATLGWNGVQGMVAYLDTASGKWVLIVGVEPGGNSDKEIYAVDPTSGAGMLLFTVSDRDPEGLAVDQNGTLFMTDGGDLYQIDWGSGNMTNRGSLGYSRVEALEFGYGFYGDPVDLTSEGVPAAWTANGALFGFDDSDDELFVADPATGNSIGIHCAFATVDCEGLVFTSKYVDGFGQVTAMAHD